MVLRSYGRVERRGEIKKWTQLENKQTFSDPTGGSREGGKKAFSDPTGGSRETMK